MKVRRSASRTAAALLVAVTLGMVGAAPVVDSVAAAQRHTPEHRLVLALGDSVPSGAACSCTPFPALYGSLLARRTGAAVSVRNDAVSGLDTAGLLAQLRQPKIVKTVRLADIFLVTIGANDFEDEHDQVVERVCTTPGATDCVSDELETMKTHLAQVLAEIRTLRQGKPTSVLVTGYWNVFEDGDVARSASGETGLQASLQLTLRANADIRSVATAAGAHYVDLFAPFQHSDRDITSLMAADGDHPDAAGHQLIARTLLDAGLPRLT